MARGRKEEFNFRHLTTGLVLLVNDRNFKTVERAFEHKLFDNAILACGYIDHRAGVTFEVLCLAEYSSNGKIDLRRGNPNTSVKLRYDSVDGIVVLLEDEILPEFQDKIDMVRDGYRVNEYVMKARNSQIFDDFRHPQYPDDVLLLFYKANVQPEGIWCRIESEIDGRPAAVLLNEPCADFGVHRGEMVTFEWRKDGDKIFGVARLPWMDEARTADM